MPKTPPKVRALARGLLRHRFEGAPPAAPADALRLVCECLRPPLSNLVGPEGFRALLARAQALAAIEHPLLGSAHLDSEGGFAGLGGFAGAPETLEEEEAASAAILANLLTLLVSFLGTEITQQLMRSAWPHLPVPDAVFGAEEGEV